MSLGKVYSVADLDRAERVRDTIRLGRHLQRRT